jgi:anti-sigma-K factor RskA
MTKLDEESRAELEALIPWYAAGTLGTRDAERVAAAIADDPELAASFDAACAELSETQHANQSLDAPSARILEKLFAQIDAEPVRRPSLTRQLAASVAGFFENLTPRTLAWATAAAAVVILGQAAVIGSSLTHPGPASGGPDFGLATVTKAPPQKGAFVLLRFDPAASATQITELLTKNRAKIVDGPETGGFYRVRVSDQPLSPAQLSADAQRLQRDKAVEFAAPTTP